MNMIESILMKPNRTDYPIEFDILQNVWST